MSNYFMLLGLRPSFDVDQKALERSYFDMQRECHPDGFVGKSAAERAAALARSADANKAYETLKHPLKRAQYLLHLQGIEVGTEQDTIKPSHALLMETMEWREQIDAAKMPEQVDQLDRSLSSMVEESISAISAAYRRANSDAMAQESLRLGYLLKAQEAVARQKAQMKRQAS